MSDLKTSIERMERVLKTLKDSAIECSRQRRLSATTSDIISPEMDSLLDKISVESDALQMWWTDLKAYLGGFFPGGGCTVGWPIDKETGRCSQFDSRYKFGMHACGSCTNHKDPEAS